MPQRVKPCERCQHHRKKCDLTHPTCGRCFKANASCYFRPESDTSQFESSPGSLPSTSNHTLIDRIVHASEEPQTGWDVPPVNSLLDSDSFATIQDYMLVMEFVNKDPWFSKSIFPKLIDTDSFMEAFFVEPPPLRLVLCTLAVQALYDKIPSLVSKNYYRRARKAVSKYMMLRPSISNLAALYLLSTCAGACNHAAFADAIFGHALDMLVHLRLDIDPDDSTDCDYLTEREKNQRRGWFWQCMNVVKYASATGDTIHHTYFSVDQVKQPDGFFTVDFFQFIKVNDTITSLRSLWSTAPSSTFSLFESEEAAHLSKRLCHILQETPSHHLLLPLSTSTNLSDLCQLYASQCSRFQHLVNLRLTLDYHAAISLLHRPMLYLLAHLAPNSPYLRNSVFIDALTQSLHRCYNSAIHIAKVEFFSLTATKRYHELDSPSQPNTIPKLFELESWGSGASFSQFEAAIVLWFITRKLPKQWQAALSLSHGYSTEAACWGISVILKSLELRESILRGTPNRSPPANEESHPTFMTPIRDCVSYMLLDMEELLENRIPDLELSLTVLSLGQDGEELKPVKTDADPYCFLGMLGVEVGGGMRWKAPYEETWREFWKRVG